MVNENKNSIFSYSSSRIQGHHKFYHKALGCPWNPGQEPLGGRYGIVPEIVVEKTKVTQVLMPSMNQWEGQENLQLRPTRRNAQKCLKRAGRFWRRYQKSKTFKEHLGFHRARRNAWIQNDRLWDTKGKVGGFGRPGGWEIMWD